MYSVTSRRSFEMIKIVYDKILDFCGKNDIPCVIVGAKTDLQFRYVYCIGSCTAIRLAPSVASSKPFILTVRIADKFSRTRAKNLPNPTRPHGWKPVQRTTSTSVRIHPPSFTLRTLKRFLGKVFELCLAEIEKRSPHSQTDQPEASKCVVM